jgi:transcriptional regulator with XRE-family HTH domain
MPISAHFRDTDRSTDIARAPRRTLFLEALGAFRGDGEVAVMVHNISVTGMLLESEVELEQGEVISVDLPDVGLAAARVIWSSGALFGCQFEHPISASALIAAELFSRRGGARVEAPPRRSVTSGEGAASAGDESFGLRIQRLRKARKLTQAQVASAVGVSKPTVWAWEQGRARPVEARMEALAAVLGVDRAALLARPDHRMMGELLTRSREQIAAAFGTSAENVRIMIEL